MPIADRIPLDANSQPIQGLYSLFSSKQVAFTGAAGLGAQGTVDLFTVTGDVVVGLFAICSEDLAGATATIEAGVANLTAGLLAQTTATDIDAGEVWVDSSPGLIQPLPTSQIVAAGADIIATIGTADITDGTLTFYAFWYPLSEGAQIVAA